MEEVKSQQLILKTYCDVTGEMINLDKFSLIFGNQIEEEVKLNIKDITGILKEGGAGTYLGLHECFSGSKIDMLVYIHERLKSRMSGFFASLLSQRG